jgi:hypothetical protein
MNNLKGRINRLHNKTHVYVSASDIRLIKAHIEVEITELGFTLNDLHEERQQLREIITNANLSGTERRRQMGEIRNSEAAFLLLKHQLLTNMFRGREIGTYFTRTIHKIGNISRSIAEAHEFFNSRRY